MNGGRTNSVNSDFYTMSIYFSYMFSGISEHNIVILYMIGLQVALIIILHHVNMFFCYLSGISVYNVVILCMVGVPIALIMKDQVDAAYALISLFIFFATTLTTCLVFVPKVGNLFIQSTCLQYFW